MTPPKKTDEKFAAKKSVVKSKAVAGKGFDKAVKKVK
jgi:hypothetical protein